MNAEALIGTVLGTCTLQKLLGQGSMGAVFLAQQSRPNRQVAVKVLLPMTALTANQRAAFLERFRRETDAAALLEHQNIVPVHEYGERDGLAYLVMPYISGGTLRDELERTGKFPPAKIVNYLDQLATALDFAHEHGVIHRDVKPANILLAMDGRLVLTDFGLVKVIAENPYERAQLTGAGLPMGTPDYMAPEQVIGGAEVDSRADIYSLGVILYHMVTGTVPFHGEMPMQIAMQHLQAPPPSPRTLRADLPVAAEQVMLRALAKRPADRYVRGQDLANAFRIALAASNVQLDKPSGSPFMSSAATATKPFTPRGLFDPSWRSDASSASSTNNFPSPANSEIRTGIFQGDATATMPGRFVTPTSALPNAETPAPAIEPAPAPTGNGTQSLLGRRTGLLRMTDGKGESIAPQPLLQNNSMLRPPAESLFPTPALQQQQGMPTGTLLPPPVNQPGMPTGTLFPPPVNQQGMPTGTLFPPPVNQPGMPTGTLLPPPMIQPGMIPPTPTGFGTGATSAFNLTTPTGALMAPGGEQATGTFKLPSPMKVVQMPVAGQPGRYVTGLLPVLTEQQSSALNEEEKKHSRKFMLKVVSAALIILLVFITGAAWYATHRSTNQSKLPATTATTSPDLTAIAQAQANATATANVILSDPLNENIHNWPISPSGSQIAIFKDGAYHITANDDNNGAVALLPDIPSAILSQPFAYSLTMQEVKGDDTNVYNKFGMIFRFSAQNKNGSTVVTFYAFEVSNVKDGDYQFWKYDNGANKTDPWKQLWPTTTKPTKHTQHEYHQGQGSANTNVFKILMNGSKFTFIVNGKQVGNVDDNSIASGSVGMLVNLKGTEVAFSNLMLTNN